MIADLDGTIFCISNSKKPAAPARQQPPRLPMNWRGLFPNRRDRVAAVATGTPSVFGGGGGRRSVR